MTISLLFAWVTVLAGVAAILKYPARKLKKPAVNRFFHRIHIPCGVIMLSAGTVHTLFAGNPYNATLTDFTPFAALLCANWGTVCLVITLLLALTYMLRKKLKKLWMILHRLLTVLLIVCLVIHLADSGISLPGRILSAVSQAGEPQSETVKETAVQESTTAAVEGTLAVQTETASAENTAATEYATVTEPETAQQQPTTTETEPQQLVSFSGAVLKDGTYQGSAQGYKGTVTVEVTVEGGAVTEITVISNSDTPNYFTRAKAIISSIISGQTLEVNAVSGATFSSAGILNAVNNALENAVVSGKLNVTEINTSGIRHK